MSTEQDSQQSTSDDPAGWGGAPAQPKRRWSPARLAVAAALAVGIAGAGTAVVYASTGSTDSTTQQAPGDGGAPMAGGGGPGGAGSLAAALHGEYVVSDGDSGYTTELMQTGEVTAISATSVTAASDDGYTKTYTIDAGTVLGNGSDIATGDEVTIVASVSGDTATADSVTEAGQQATPPDQNSTS